MRKFLIFLVAVSLLVWTNPSQADHQRVFADTFKAENPVLGFLGIGNAASVFIAYDSYAVFSVGRVGDRVVSIGALGKVFSKAPPIEREIAESLRGGR
jgi:hypothetical protein